MFNTILSTINKSKHLKYTKLIYVCNLCICSSECVEYEFLYSYFIIKILNVTIEVH